MTKITRIQNHLSFDKANVQKCSFCGTTRACVSGLIQGEHICMHCIQASSEVLDIQPAGSVACLKCRQYLSFTLHYPGFIQVKFDAMDLDRSNTTIYMPTMVRGGTNCKWDMTMKPQKAVCNDCGAKVPLDLFKRTNYIAS